MKSALPQCRTWVDDKGTTHIHVVQHAVPESFMRRTNRTLAVLLVLAVAATLCTVYAAHVAHEARRTADALRTELNR